MNWFEIQGWGIYSAGWGGKAREFNSWVCREVLCCLLHGNSREEGLKAQAEALETLAPNICTAKARNSALEGSSVSADGEAGGFWR